MTTTKYFYYTQKDGLNRLCSEITGEKSNHLLWDRLIQTLPDDKPADDLPAGLTLQRMRAEENEITQYKFGKDLFLNKKVKTFFDNVKISSLDEQFFITQKYQLDYGEDYAFDILSLARMEKNEQRLMPVTLGFYQVIPHEKSLHPQDGAIKNFLLAHSTNHSKNKDYLSILHGNIQSLVRYSVMKPGLIASLSGNIPKPA